VDSTGCYERLLEIKLNFWIKGSNKEKIEAKIEILLLGRRIRKSTPGKSLIVLIGQGDLHVKVQLLPNKEL
jgi:hypothetical protein